MCLSFRSGPNGSGALSDEAGLEEMVNLANSQLQEDANYHRRLGRRTPQPEHEAMDTIPNDTNLAPVNLRW